MNNTTDAPTLAAPPSNRDDPHTWPDGETVYHTGMRRYLTGIEIAALTDTSFDYRRQLWFRPGAQVVPGVLFEGLNLLFAPPKIGKTILATQLMLAVATGRDWLGRTCHRGPVLCIELEESIQQVVERELRLWDGQGDPAIRLVTDLGHDPAERQARLVEMLVEGHHGQPWALVVIDTLSRYAGAGDARNNAYDRGLETAGPLDRLGLKYHTAILAIHHTKQAVSDDWFESAIGSSSITGSAQMCLYLQRTRGSEHGTLHVDGRHEPSTFAVTFRDGAYRLTDEMSAAAASRTGVPHQVLSLLDARGPLPLPAIVDALRANYNTVHSSITRLSDDRQVRYLGEKGWDIVRPAKTETPARQGGTVATTTADHESHPGAVGHDDDQRRSETASSVAAGVDNLPDKVGNEQVNTVVTLEIDTAGTAEMRPVYTRPTWLPDPLDHPIGTFIRLVDEEFRLKRVQLVGHPWPKADDVPAPLRNRGRGRGMAIHEGKHHWANPGMPEDVEVEILDRPGSYLSVLGSVELPIGKLQPAHGRPSRGRAGIHRLTVWPTFSGDWADALPHPGGSTPRGSDIWITTPTLDLMDQIAATGVLSTPQIAESLVCRTMRLERLQTRLRDARQAAIDYGDSELVEFIKKTYSQGISTLGESTWNTHIWRPDWAAMIRAQFNANLWRMANRLRSHNVTICAVRNTDEIHVLAGSPWRDVVTEGRGLAHLAVKGEPYTWPGDTSARR